MSNQLQASQVKWKRLRKLVLTTLVIGSAGGFAVYALGGGSLMLDADGLVTRQTVAVASPWPDARIRADQRAPGRLGRSRTEDRRRRTRQRCRARWQISPPSRLA